MLAVRHGPVTGITHNDSRDTAVWITVVPGFVLLYWFHGRPFIFERDKREEFECHFVEK